MRLFVCLAIVLSTSGLTTLAHAQPTLTVDRESGRFGRVSLYPAARFVQHFENPNAGTHLSLGHVAGHVAESGRSMVDPELLALRSTERRQRRRSGGLSGGTVFGIIMAVVGGLALVMLAVGIVVLAQSDAGLSPGLDFGTWP